MERGYGQVPGDDAVERAVEAWLEDRVVAPGTDGLHETLSQVPTTPQMGPRFRGRWFRRDGGDRRRAGAHVRPLASSRGTTLMAAAAGVTAVLAIMLLTANAVPWDEASFGLGAATLSVAVDGSGEHTSISAALAEARAGDTIEVSAGTYSEALYIDKNVNIIGLGAHEDVVIEANSVDGCVIECGVHIQDASPALRGLTLTGGDRAVVVQGGSPAFDRINIVHAGLEIGSGTRLVLRDSWMRAAGIDLLEGAAATVTGNEVTGGSYIKAWGLAEGSAISANTLSDSIVVVAGPTGMLIEDNRFIGGGQHRNVGVAAVQIGAAFGGRVDGIAPTIRRNRFESNGRVGIIVDPGTEPTIQENTFTDTKTAMQIGDSTALVSDNTISDGTTGIVVVSRGNPTIEGNVIDVTGRGIVAGANTSPTISGNDVCGGDVSIYVSDAATPALSANDTCEAGVIR